MRKVFFIFSLIISCITECMSPDQKPLRDEFVNHLIGERPGGLSRAWTAQKLYDWCKEEALAIDLACHRREAPENISCTIISQAQRHLRCWWLYKQALSLAINGPTDDMLAQVRIPNTAYEGSSYQWCQTPQDWYDQCSKICNGKRICTDDKGRNRYCTIFDNMSCHRTCKKEFKEDIQKAKAFTDKI